MPKAAKSPWEPEGQENSGMMGTEEVEARRTKVQKEVAWTPCDPVSESLKSLEYNESKSPIAIHPT